MIPTVFDSVLPSIQCCFAIRIALIALISSHNINQYDKIRKTRLSLPFLALIGCWHPVTTIPQTTATDWLKIYSHQFCIHQFEIRNTYFFTISVIANKTHSYSHFQSHQHYYPIKEHHLTNGNPEFPFIFFKFRASLIELVPGALKPIRRPVSFLCCQEMDLSCMCHAMRKAIYPRLFLYFIEERVFFLFFFSSSSNTSSIMTSLVPFSVVKTYM